MPTFTVSEGCAAELRTVFATPVFTANTVFPAPDAVPTVDPHEGFDTLAGFMHWANSQRQAVYLNTVPVVPGMGPPLRFVTTAAGRYELEGSASGTPPPISTPIPNPKPPTVAPSNVRIFQPPSGWWANPSRLQLTIGQGEMVAVEFSPSTNPSPANNPPHFTLAQFTGNPISHDVALTSIPGAFWVNLMPNVLQGSTNTVHFTVGPNPWGYAPLEAGRGPYYINIRNTDPNGPASDCFIDFVKPQGDTY